MKGKKIKKRYIVASVLGSIGALIFIFFMGYGFYLWNTSISKPKKLTSQEEEILQAKIQDFSLPVIRNLNYKVNAENLSFNAKSVVAVDYMTGNILFEKNDNEPIPPASLTKLVLTYCTLKKVKNQNLDLNAIVELPRESWAKNAPPHSSLMFLGEGQKVTLNELLEGLNVVSGNDAAVAIAIYMFGSVENCISTMNETVSKMGLTHTHFADVSGYSEKNITCAREFVKFCMQYIHEFPWTLQKYHSLKSYTYPKERNLKAGWTLERAKTEGSAIEGTLPITQKATNRALDAIPYADGLKTGYIDESGYNLALTVCRENQRLVVVSLGGPGNGSIEGNTFRVQDAKTITDWVYSNFWILPIEKMDGIKYNVLGGSRYCCNLVEVTRPRHFVLLPYISHEFEVPKGIERKIVLDTQFTDSVECGKQYGHTEYWYGEYLVDSVPLVADRTIKRGNIFRRLYAKMYQD